MDIHEFQVETPTGLLTCGRWTPSPEDRSAHPRLLLSFAMTRQDAFDDPTQNNPARLWAAVGHDVVSFDLPNHGQRVSPFGQGLAGMCSALVAGQDPFAQFVEDGRAVIDACLQMGLGQGGIALAGVSRAGYCALRLAAADPRISAVAGLAPVTDWRRLREFAAETDRPEVAALALSNWAEQLAQRAVYLAIGNRDERVGTDACIELAQRIYAAEALQTAEGSTKALHIVVAEGHSLPDPWRQAGAQFLLDHVAG